jgi:hypothetical protein
VLKTDINWTSVLHEHTVIEQLIIDCVYDIVYITHKTSCENMTVNEYNLINCCGSILPAINEGKEVGLLHHNIKNAVTHLLSKKKTSLLTVKFMDFVNMIRQ